MRYAFVRRNVAKDGRGVHVAHASLGAVARRAHPTNDHHAQLHYTLVPSDKGTPVTKLHTGMDMGSIRMHGFLLGLVCG